MWAYSPKIAKISIFWYKFAQKVYTPLSDFLNKIWLGEGVPGPHPHAKFHHCGLKKCGPTAPKIGINSNFLYKFAPNGKFWGL